ncbi:MAG: hypothetical protein JWQ38_1901 [Flavipsychrobacter sp.]|nr:hypothetical protein [Flavipsychrobacter sp.]
MSDNIIQDTIKAQVQQILPFAKVLLFGSRAYGTPNAESDWDILILTREPVSSTIKRNIHNAIFPISVKIGAFINTLTVQEDDWNNAPSYYTLKRTVEPGMIAL